MDDIFKELESFGLKEESIQIFEPIIKEEEPVLQEKKEQKLEEINFLYDGTRTCPVCENIIKDRLVKTARIRLSKTDLDLRPIYDAMDPSKYDVVICNRCGYAAIRKVFNHITPGKILLIRKKISPHFIGKEYPLIYDYDIAIERFKLALFNAISIEAKDSEKAYVCLKIAWLYRGKAELLMGQSNQEQEVISCQSEETRFIQYSLEGFMRAYTQERFPVLDLDELTIQFLIGELSRLVGLYDQSIEWVSKVIIDTKASRRLKERARESKLLAKKAKSAE